MVRKECRARPVRRVAEDSDLLGEVELTTNLIIAASETDEHLTKAEIDEILGVAHGPSA